MIRVLDFLPPQMPADKPRYLMGVGKPEAAVYKFAMEKANADVNIFAGEWRAFRCPG